MDEIDPRSMEYQVRQLGGWDAFDQRQSFLAGVGAGLRHVPAGTADVERIIRAAATAMMLPANAIMVTPEEADAGVTIRERAIEFVGWAAVDARRPAWIPDDFEAWLPAALGGTPPADPEGGAE